MGAIANRRGVALVAALALIVLLGLLTAGAFATTAMSQRSARLVQSDELLGAAADYAATTVLTSSTEFGLADLPLGISTSFVVPTAQPDRVRGTVGVTRLPGQLLWLTSDADLTGPEQGHRRIGIVARFGAIGPLPSAGIVARGTIDLGDSSLVAIDSTGDADCRPHNAPLTAQLSDSAVYYLTAHPSAVLDSASAVTHVRGDTIIAGGSFTGILIVGGAVTVLGTWSANGLIVARGPITAARGFSMRGAVLSFSADVPAVRLTGSAITYDPCAVAQALRRALPPRPIRRRSWADLF
ncbi:MAG TPA: hypothetical protein VN706_22750 [Gemmatimonadaceae bacterium]|nr:hypothetical protein [Gemmatimonadaceae bacterium]